MNMGRIKYVKFFSDSQAAIKALNKSEITSKIVLDAHMALNMLAKDTRRCDLVWVKAHAGHDGNEEADHMARKATLLDDPKKIALPKSAVK